MRPAPFELERFFARFEFAVPYLMGSSDCEAPTLDELLALESGAAGRHGELRLGYSESEGAPELREAIATLYSSCGPDDVVVHGAAVEVIFAYMNAMLEAGDGVVVQTPCFSPLAEIASAIGCTVEPWPARPEAGWQPDLDELDRLLRHPTRLVVVNFPHNPTGFLPERDWFAALVALVERSGARLFCDEIFRLLEHDPSRRLPAACDLTERAASLGGMSKVFGLGGLRVGWLATREREVRERVLGFKDYTSTCAPIVCEQLAALALRRREAIVARNRQRVLENVERFAAFCERRSGWLEWRPPVAGTVAFPECLQLPDVDRFCETLAHEAGVLLIPGSTFGMPRHVRVGFGRTRFAEGLEQLERFIGV
jgi:aspartate/methionine/tyrosine aminotransferase